MTIQKNSIHNAIENINSDTALNMPKKIHYKYIKEEITMAIEQNNNTINNEEATYEFRCVKTFSKFYSLTDKKFHAKVLLKCKDAPIKSLLCEKTYSSFKEFCDDMEYDLRNTDFTGFDFEGVEDEELEKMNLKYATIPYDIAARVERLHGLKTYRTYLPQA